jgi:hypothetical protein
MLKVGVVFGAAFADPGEYLADARALEAADVDSVWIAAEASGEMLLAAIAAVTTRIRLGLLASTTDVAEAFARPVETLQRLSRSRALVGVIRENVVEVVAPARERWLCVPMPKDRAAWQETLARGEADGVDGVLVPQDDRLLDILRTPLEEDDRRDLVLAQG